MVALVALVVFHVSTMEFPAVTDEGEAEIVALGAVVTGGAVTTGVVGAFFLQPAWATKATSTTTGTAIRI